MSNALLIALPEAATGAPAETHWWHVVSGQLAGEGFGTEWLTISSARATGLRVIGLAPSAVVRLVFDQSDRRSMTPGQAAGVARIEALDSALGDRETLHAVSKATAADGRIVTAIVANGAMIEWIDWAREQKVELDAIIPSAMALPLAEHWTSASIGNDHIVARVGQVLPNEPAIAEALIGSDPVEAIDPDEMRSTLVQRASRPEPNLRSGRFAKRRRFLLERDRVRELLVLAAIIPVVTLLWALVSIWKLDRKTEALDQESIAIASSALGRQVALENAEAELSQSSGSGLTAPLSALYQALQSEAQVSSTQIGYGSGGTLSATLAAPSVNDINRLLIALQRDGYKVTAVPRQAPDGRAMVELTMRVGP